MPLSLKAEVGNETCYLRDLLVKVEVLIILCCMSRVLELHAIKMLLPWLRGSPTGYALIRSKETKRELVDIPFSLLLN